MLLFFLSTVCPLKWALSLYLLLCSTCMLPECWVNMFFFSVAATDEKYYFLPRGWRTNTSGFFSFFFYRKGNHVISFTAVQLSNIKYLSQIVPCHLYLGLDFIFFFFFFFSKPLLLSIFFHPSTVYFNHKQTALTSNPINMVSKHKLYQSWFAIWILFAYGQEIFWNL